MTGTIVTVGLLCFALGAVAGWLSLFASPKKAAKWKKSCPGECPLSDEARRVREAADEEAKAWATLQHYNAMDAYACRETEGGG